MLKLACLFVLFALLFGASAFAHAINIRGKVLNGTTRKPSAGEEVVLLRLSQDGMTETIRTRTDPMGRFSFAVDDPSDHLMRVIHDGVTYHKAVEPGLKALVVEVYDIAESLEGVSAVMDVQRLEATQDTLEIKQLVTMRNQSRPPRTLAKDRTFQIQLSPRAQVVSGMIQIGTGQPVKQKPVRGEQEGQYYFSSPIRPGDTRFAIVYQIPYEGEMLIEPSVRNHSERFVVMLPHSMRFEPAIAGIFRPMPGSSPDNVQGTAPVNSDQNVAFRIKGTGTLEEFAGHRQQPQIQTRGKAADQKPMPGGGLGPPIDSPDPLQKHRWQILAGITFLVVMGARYAIRRGRSLNVGSRRIGRRRTHSHGARA